MPSRQAPAAVAQLSRLPRTDKAQMIHSLETFICSCLPRRSQQLLMLNWDSSQAQTKGLQRRL